MSLTHGSLCRLRRRHNRLFALVTVDVPYWNWYSFPAEFVASEAIEHIVGWFVVGLAIAAIVRAPRARAVQ